MKRTDIHRAKRLARAIEKNERRVRRGKPNQPPETWAARAQRLRAALAAMMTACVLLAAVPARAQSTCDRDTLPGQVCVWPGARMVNIYGPAYQSYVLLVPGHRVATCLDSVPPCSPPYDDPTRWQTRAYSVFFQYQEEWAGIETTAFGWDYVLAPSCQPLEPQP